MGRFNKRFCIESCQEFANLILLSKVPRINGFLKDVENRVVGIGFILQSTENRLICKF